MSASLINETGGCQTFFPFFIWTVGLLCVFRGNKVPVYLFASFF